MMIRSSLSKNPWFVFRIAYLWLLAIGLPAASAWCQEVPPPIGGSSQQKSYVYQYMLVGLCVALGMVLLCRPKKRSQEVEKLPD